MFWEALPSYLAIGMTADEFWHGEPRLSQSYMEAWKLSKESQYSAEWRQGLYVQEAVASLLLKDAKYPEAPLFTTETAEEIAERKARERMEHIRDAFLGKAKQLAAKRAGKTAKEV